ncbi:unnamed protein product [Effrenium voratum]|uniref:BTB domain-containing protein n=1 Tax=Effrenium voratum TaxID=2562239 RepID=A0AA36ITI0_9DINO|nr:unnamed protein product [Effrenium voratum]CAJ1393222.1 unnamed protein product [Effrenium voratum]CAJ1420033.1 unnamed protein product [Effrenium voratum]CAJ1450172.1 unnamed protein product [Effrenium voratum]|mmetsp:Transcript_27085/g.64466  ORF Transcript_27085/g.64466 Transcript_27085/m.64466 type:complete len:344 (+) Transcript_27085:74-1105(+)
MPTTRPVWDRALSSYMLVFDDDWTVRVPGSAGSESPLALVPAEYVGEEFMVRVVEFPGDGNSISVGGIYGTGTAPCQAGDLGFLPQSFGIRSQHFTNSQVGTKGSRRDGPIVKSGDSIMVKWSAGNAEVFVNDARVWHGSLLAPARARRFFGASVADNAVLRIEATQKHSRIPVCYTERLLQNSIFTDVTILCADGTVEAHKALLAASSPVFYRMFESGMLESRDGRVNIDAPKEVVSSLLRHVYTGAFDPNIDAAAMIELAHMYDLQDLAAFCGEILVDNVAPANVSQCAEKIRRLRSTSASNAETDDIFEQIWQRLMARIQQDPVLMRAVLESHNHEREPC